MTARGLHPGQIYWGHSDTGRGSWSGTHTTREAAIAEGRGEYGGDPFWICGGPAIASELIDASDVVEMLMERACEAAGHDVEEPIDILPDSDLLQAMLDFWCARHVVVNAWQEDREPERVQ